MKIIEKRKFSEIFLILGQSTFFNMGKNKESNMDTLEWEVREVEAPRKLDKFSRNVEIGKSNKNSDQILKIS